MCIRDSLDRARRDARAKRRRHNLRAETNPQHRLVRFEAHRDRCNLVSDERIAVALVNADRTAEHDQQIGRQQRFRVERLDSGIVIADAIAARGNERPEQTEILEGHVANRKAFFDHAAVLTHRRCQCSRQRIGPLRDRTGAEAYNCLLYTSRCV